MKLFQGTNDLIQITTSRLLQMFNEKLALTFLSTYLQTSIIQICNIKQKNPVKNITTYYL